jgi:hypothetical protein
MSGSVDAPLIQIDEGSFNSCRISREATMVQSNRRSNFVLTQVLDEALLISRAFDRETARRFLEARDVHEELVRDVLWREEASRRGSCWPDRRKLLGRL